MTAAPHYSVTPSSVAYAPPHNYAQGVTPTYTPSHNYAQSSTPSYSPASNYAHSATPTSVNYPSGVTASPLSHTLGSPAVPHGLLPARLPIHPLHSGFPGLGYHQSPVFIPIQSVGHQPNFEGHPGLVLGRVNYPLPHSEQDDTRNNGANEGRSGYYNDAEERRPSQFNGDVDNNSAEKSHDSQGYDKGYKFGSDEVFARSSPHTFYRSRPSEERGSYEESGSREAESDERAAAGSGTFQARALHGDGKVATSYQSVTLETHDPSQPLYSQRQIPKPSS